MTIHRTNRQMPDSFDLLEPRLYLASVDPGVLDVGLTGTDSGGPEVHYIDSSSTGTGTTAWLKDAEVGSQTGYEYFELENVGDETATLHNFSVTYNAADFVFTVGSPDGENLLSLDSVAIPAHGTLRIYAVCTPTMGGTRSAQLGMYYTDSPSGYIGLSVVGRGIITDLSLDLGELEQGEDGSVTVPVSVNTVGGEATDLSQGTVIDVRLSRDGTFDETDIRLQMIDLAGKTVSEEGKLDLSLNYLASLDGQYFVVARISGFEPDKNQANDNASTTALIGNIRGEDAAVVFIKQDESTKVPVRLEGPGSLIVIQQPYHAGDIRVYGSTADSSLIVGSSSTYEQGATSSIKSIIVGSPEIAGDCTSIGKILAGGSTLYGDITMTGSLATLELYSAPQGGQITVGAREQGDKTQLEFSMYFADSLSLTSGVPIASISALSWTDSSGKAAIVAPSIASLAITGYGDTLAGDFAPALVLTGGDSKYTLGKVNIAGSVADSTWDVNGMIKKIRIDGAAGDFGGTSWTLNNATLIKVIELGYVGQAYVNAGVIRSLSADAWDAGGINANSLGRMRITGQSGNDGLAGNFGANVTLTPAAGASASSPLLRSAKIDGVISGEWNVNGSIRSIRAAYASQWDCVLAGQQGRLTRLTLSDRIATSEMNVSAATIGALRVPGSVKASTINLTSADAASKALARFVVGNSLDSSTIRSAGSIGTIEVGILSKTNVLAGVKESVSQSPSSVDDFASTDASLLPTIRALKVHGGQGGSAWQESNVAAGNIKKVRLPEQLQVSGSGSSDFGGITVTSKIKNYRGPEGSEETFVRIV